jgi:hypothetical protein
MQNTINETRMKQIFKEALIEMIEEKKEMFQGLIIDAIEEIALVNAIHEGEKSEKVSKEEIFSIMDGQV